MKNVAGRSLDAGDAQVIAANDGRQGELTREAEVAKRVFEATDRHVRDLADGIVNHFGTMHLHFGCGHSEDAAAGDLRELLGQAEIDQTIGATDETDAADDLRSGKWDRRRFGIHLRHELRLLAHHRLEDALDRSDNAVLDKIIGDLSLGVRRDHGGAVIVRDIWEFPEGKFLRI